jgi:hypothetical protein
MTEWRWTLLEDQLKLVLNCKARGLMVKEAAVELGICKSTLSRFSSTHGINWPKGARVGNKNAEVHGEGHNTIKRLTKRIMLAADRDITTCERCGWHHPLNESLARHHKDRNRNNNDLDNLEVLCQSCHSKEHLNDRPRNEEGQFTSTDDCGGGLG